MHIKCSPTYSSILSHIVGICQFRQEIPPWVCLWYMQFPQVKKFTTLSQSPPLPFWGKKGLKFVGNKFEQTAFLHFFPSPFSAQRLTNLDSPASVGFHNHLKASWPFWHKLNIMSTWLPMQLYRVKRELFPRSCSMSWKLNTKDNERIEAAYNKHGPDCGHT